MSLFISDSLGVGTKQAVTLYVCHGLISIHDAIRFLGGSTDRSDFFGEATDRGLAEALKSGQVKAVALSGSSSYLLPPAFWKISRGESYSVGALNAFGQGIVDNMVDADRIGGLKDIQGCVVAFDEQSFEGWRNSRSSKRDTPKPHHNTGDKSKKPNVANSELKKFLEEDAKESGSIPARDNQWKRAKKAFPDKNVPRSTVTSIRHELFGPLSSGPRKRQEA